MSQNDDFASLPLSPALLQGVAALGYERMTPIQAQGLPALLEGRDLIAQAPTGSGKTAAFGLGLLHRLDPADGRTQALVLCPTRELADQVGRQLRKLAFAIPNLKVSVLCGGMPLGPQLASLEHAPHVVVGTPGRLQELVRKQALRLDAVPVLKVDLLLGSASSARGRLTSRTILARASGAVACLGCSIHRTDGGVNRWRNERKRDRH